MRNVCRFQFTSKVRETHYITAKSISDGSPCWSGGLSIDKCQDNVEQGGWGIRELSVNALDLVGRDIQHQTKCKTLILSRQQFLRHSYSVIRSQLLFNCWGICYSDMVWLFKKEPHNQIKEQTRKIENPKYREDNNFYQTLLQDH